MYKKHFSFFAYPSFDYPSRLWSHDWRLIARSYCTVLNARKELYNYIIGKICKILKKIFLYDSCDHDQLWIITDFYNEQKVFKQKNSKRFYKIILITSISLNDEIKSTIRLCSTVLEKLSITATN